MFVLGGPGCGKGTNCSKIVKDFGYTHLSAGDLLRNERKSQSDLADMINNYIKEGKIVPAEVTVKLLKDAMEESDTENFLIDGFPRDLDNLECWNNLMTEFAETQFLLFLDCPNDVMVARLMERGKTSGRNDDNMETIQKRIVVYENMTKPIIEHFRKIDKVCQIDANRAEDAVYADIKAHFLKTAPSTRKHSAVEATHSRMLKEGAGSSDSKGILAAPVVSSPPVEGGSNKQAHPEPSA